MAQSQAKTAWDRANTRNITLKLNRNTDADIFQKLETVPSVAGYIKQAIRADIEREKNLQKSQETY